MNVEQIRRRAVTAAGQLQGENRAASYAEAVPVNADTLLALLDIAEELRGVLEAGKLPEAETGIFADMFARLDTEDDR